MNLTSTSKIVYHFPFAFPEKERERSRVLNGRVVVYSPASTKEAYKKIRSHILTHYPNYEQQRVMKSCNVALAIYITKQNDKADLDNRLKMLDALNRDASRKENSGFKGVWKDDKVIKGFDGTRIYYVETEAEERTILTITPLAMEVGK